MPVLRLEVEIEGKGKPSVRLDGQFLTVADEVGRLSAYELTYGEMIRD